MRRREQLRTLIAVTAVLVASPAAGQACLGGPESGPPVLGVRLTQPVQGAGLRTYGGEMVAFDAERDLHMATGVDGRDGDLRFRLDMGYAPGPLCPVVTMSAGPGVARSVGAGVGWGQALTPAAGVFVRGDWLHSWLGNGITSPAWLGMVGTTLAAGPLHVMVAAQANLEHLEETAGFAVAVRIGQSR